jgi:hypothetical protein
MSQYELQITDFGGFDRCVYLVVVKHGHGDLWSHLLSTPCTHSELFCHGDAKAEYDRDARDFLSKGTKKSPSKKK